VERLALERGAVDGWERVERGALLRRALRGAVGQAVPLVAVGLDDARAGRRFAGEEVVGDGEVLEPRERADGLRDGAGEAVVRDVELLDAAHPGHLHRQGPDERVEADVEDGELAEHADLRRNAGGEAVVDEEDLVERAGHVPEAGGQAAAEGVVGEHDDGGRGVAEVVGERGAEAVVVEEDGVERAVEELRRDGALEVVEAEVEEAERRQVEHDGGERAHEAVVAEVQLGEEAQPTQRGREQAAEAVGVEVEQREVGEEAELRGEVPGDVAVVEVHPGDRELPGAGLPERDARAEDARVVADPGADPVSGEAPGVGEDGLLLPRLQRDVRVPQPLVREPPGRVHRHRLRPLHRRFLAGGGPANEEEEGEHHQQRYRVPHLTSRSHSTTGQPKRKSRKRSPSRGLPLLAQCGRGAGGWRRRRVLVDGLSGFLGVGRGGQLCHSSAERGRWVVGDAERVLLLRRRRIYGGWGE
jgi:hypothetical protein